MTDTSSAIAARLPHQRTTTPKPSADPAPRSILLVQALRALPWAVVVAALLGAMVWSGTPDKQILRYAAYWVIGVVVPGTLVFRALRGSRGNLPEDVGLGAVTGFAVQLIGWALFVGTGLGGWLQLWPLLVIAPFVAVPRLRRHWSLRSAEPMRLSASWAIAGVMLIAIAILASIWWGTNPLPPTAHSLFGDIYYHWANAAELRRTITPQQPQQAGDPLIYHWFSDAYRASATMMSGVPLSTVMLRLWIGPVVLTGALAVAALGRHVSGIWWAGPVAALVSVVLPVATIWPGYVAGSFTVMPVYSPTMVFAVPVITAVAYLLVDVARGVPLGRAWILFAALLPLATASKSSALPILFGGICLATAASWVIHRRPPRMLLAAVVAALATLAVTRPTLAGGEAGASVQLGAWYTFKPDFGWLTTEKYVPGAPGGLLPQAWWHMPWGTRMALFVLILTMMVSQLGRIAGFAALLHRKTRGDVAAWLLAGMGFAGWAGVLLVNHVSNGEGYFLYSAIPAMSALTAWLLAVAVPARRRVLVVFGGVAAGWITGAWLERAGPGGDRLGHGGISNSNPGGGGRPVWAAHWRYDLLVPMAALVGVVAVGALVWWLARVRWRAALAGAGVAVLVAGAVGLAADTTVRGLQGSVRELSAGRLPTGGTQGRFWVTKAEMRAAQWLARNAPTKDIVATNVHCEGVKTPALQPCINRSFWVSAMTEHAVVIEGWAYQPGTMGRHGEGGLPSYLLPPADPERLQVNDAAFFQPTPERLAELKSKYHVKWLYADSRASGVSPALASLAVERYRAGTVVVYELP